MERDSSLHVVMFPWLAMGHLIPFLELSKRLAEKGHRVSLASTPKNIQRLPSIPANLESLVHLVTLPFPRIDGLPDGAEASTDIPIQKTQLLKIAFDGLETPLCSFLENSQPDWIIYDYASHWLPPVAAKLGIRCCFFSLFTAATLAFIGPRSELLSKDGPRLTPEELTMVPKWIPFPSNIVYKLHEILPYFESAATGDIVSSASDFVRFGVSIRDCEFVALRSSVEFEPEWIKFLAELYNKPVISVGSLHPSLHEEEGRKGDYEKWDVIKEWLDKQATGSVVYMALGTEAVLTKDQVKELALGLEQSGLPFYWVLRNPPGLVQNMLEMLPLGFIERTEGRGMVSTSWAPQVRILGHDSVGGFLTHCGWNSVVEGLGFGRVLILLPVLNEQGLNARLLEGKKVGLEIPRNEQDGSFTGESVAESLKTVMVSEAGEILRTKSRQMKKMFGDKKDMDQYMDGFVRYLKSSRLENGESST